MVVMGPGKPITAAGRRAIVLRKKARRRSRIVLAAIVVVSIIVPICVTILFVGDERTQGYAILALALLIVTIGFLPLFQRPISKSLQSPVGGPPTQYVGFHGW